MPSYQTIALASSIADSVRSTMTSPFGQHPAHTEVARGHGPCRHCLRTFQVGAEKRILFTFDPFAESGVPPLPGPIYIHQESCERYPVDGGLPEDLRSRSLTLNAYARDRKLVAEEQVTDGHTEAAIERLLTLPEVVHIHVRDTEAGCYDLRIEPRG